MKYDIRVGDYVETWDGHIGYISDIVIDSSAPSAYLWITIHRCIGEQDTFYGYEYQLRDRFKRIGQYDLSKSKIDELNVLKATNTSFEDEVQVKIKVQAKINELIERVNYLLDKQDKA